MCGIAAVLGPLPIAQREAIVSEMCALLAHRGPDGAGIFSAALGFDADFEAGITLGHRRLAILDLSTAAAQPMHRGPLSISYNGEFYNYLEKRAELAAAHPTLHWHSRGDVDVLLALLEQRGLPQALDEVNGMFAFALWDKRQRCLWLARDRFGEKPLYYLLDRERSLCIVASEIKAVLHAARRLRLLVRARLDVLACYLADAEYEVGEATFFGAISRVQPGELLRIDADMSCRLTLRKHRYYELSPERCAPSFGSGGAAANDERFVELLSDSLRLRLRSDVKVGACLSGGLDSSSLVCLATDLLGKNSTLETFSAIHQKNDPCDERAYIDAVVAHLGLPNTRINPQTLLQPSNFAAFLQHHDEPIGGASVFAQHAVYRLMATFGVRVAISGQGADECLTGYRGTHPALLAELLRRGQWIGRGALRSALRHLLRRSLPLVFDRAWSSLRWQMAFADNRYFRLSKLGPAPPLPAPPPYLAQFTKRSLLHGYLYSLLCGSSLGTILRYEDRNSMAASVEARAPFLDHRVVEHCLGRTATDLADSQTTKLLLRRALGPQLPPLVRNRRDKIGFAAPEARFLQGPLRPLVLDVLYAPPGQQALAGLFDYQAMRRHYEQAHSAEALNSHTLWKALNVELWLRQHSLSI